MLEVRNRLLIIVTRITSHSVHFSTKRIKEYYMRVISGSARRTNLKTVPGESTRPTTDRIKETLFNMIQGELYDCLFLDLFSGSGAIGIEALSRGARRCYFVEQAKEAVACIRQNLDATHLGQKAVVMDCDVLAAIGRLKGKEKPFDFIFMDPPYNKNFEFHVLDELRQMDYVDDHTVIIVEASKETSFDYLDQFGYEMIKRKEYKTNMHIFIQKK